MSKRGKTPSLVGGGAGSVRFRTAGKKRKCRRCSTNVPKGTKCGEVGIPGSLGRRTYCLSCFLEIIEQSRRDLVKFEQEVRASAEISGKALGS